MAMGLRYPQRIGEEGAGKARVTSWRGGRGLRGTQETSWTCSFLGSAGLEGEPPEPGCPDWRPWLCLSWGSVCRVGKVISRLCTPDPHEERRQPHHSQPSLLGQTHLHSTLMPHFPSPINLPRWEISPFFPSPDSQKQYARSRTSKGQRSHLGKSIFGCEGASPGPLGRGQGDRPLGSWGRQ